MTLLTALNDAQRLLSLTVTSAIVADGQETQILLLALAKNEAEEVLDRDEYAWPLLKRTQSFTASLASLQASGTAANYHRAIEETFWNASQDRKIAGPLNDQEWALANGDAVTSSIQQYAMFRYDGLHIFPAPTVADTITYDYIIDTPVLATDGTTYKETFTSDTDVFVLGDRILRLGVVWRYKQSKGRDYAEDQRNYEFALAALYRKQKGAGRILSIAPYDSDDPPVPLIPDTGYGA